jgi:replicative DNA helicase
MIWSNELEQSVLACLLIDPECVCEVERLSEDDFSNQQNQQILKAVKHLFAERKNIDYLTVFQHLGKKADLAYLTSISNSLPTTANFDTYLEQLKEITIRRKIYYLADTLKQGAIDGEDGVLELAEQGIYNLRDDTDGDSQDIINTINDVMVDIDNRLNSSGSIMGLKTGFRDIDKFTDGLKETDYAVLAARPSIGKSALAFNIAQRCEGNVDVYCMEMGQKAVYRRMLLADAGISALKIRSGSVTPEERSQIMDKLSVSAKKMLDGRIRVIDKRLSIPEIKSLSRKRKAKEGLDLIIIDYLQLVKSHGKDRYERVTNTSMEIREMIMDLRIPVLALAQLNREAGQNKIPEIRELKESGQIEQDADIIMLLHREDYYDITQNKRPENEGKVDLIFAKQRDNPVGSIKLGFIKNCTKFVDIDQLLQGDVPAPAGAPW